MDDRSFEEVRGRLNGVSRRDFMKYCSAMAAFMGLPVSMGTRIAEAVTSPKRPVVIWLSAQECTGCTETLLRTSHPSLDSLILNLISLDYHETLAAGAGHQAEEYRAKSIKENEGKFILVVDGSIPTKDGGVYCKIAGRTALDILKETAPKAAAVLCIGSCASWGGIPSANPNPTGAKPVHEILAGTGITVVNHPGCPPVHYNLLSTILHFLTFKKLPALDEKNRPVFGYGRLIHENCPRRPHFDAGRFVKEFGDEGHRLGYCLYMMGCKGPETFNNCPTVCYNDLGPEAWPVGTGFPCFGCSEDGVGFFAPLHSFAKPTYVTPPIFFTKAQEEEGEGASTLAAGVAGAAIGAGVAAVAMGAKKKQD